MVNMMRADIEVHAAAGVGGGRQIMTAVSLCLEHGLVVPQWLADAFRQRVTNVIGMEVKSWDAPEAFGAPFPPSFQLEKERERFWHLRIFANLFHLFTCRHPELIPKFCTLFQEAPLAKHPEVVDPLRSLFVSRAMSRTAAYEMFAEAESLGLIKPRPAAVGVLRNSSQDAPARGPSKHRRV